MTPRRIIGTFYAITALFNLAASLIWGVNTLFLLDAGLSVFHVFVATAAFTLGQVIFEVPTGVIADTVGRRASLLFATVSLLLGTLWYVALAATSASLVWWLVSSIVLGLGFTFYSGAVEAWFVDALGTTGDHDLGPIFARNQQVFGAAMLVGTILGGVLGQWHLSAPYVARAGLLVALGVLAWTIKDIGFEKRTLRFHHIPREVRDVAVAGWQNGVAVRPVRLIMTLSLLHMGFLIWGWYAWQPYFLELLGQNLVWVAGVIASGVSLLMIVGNQIVRWLGPRVRPTTTILVGSTGLAVAMIAVGLANTFAVAVAAFLVGMVFFGIVGPSKQTVLHALIPSKQRATIVSFDGLVASAGGVVSQPTLARLAQSQGYGAGYLAGGVVLALGIPAAWLLRRIRPTQR